MNKKSNKVIFSSSRKRTSIGGNKRKTSSMNKHKRRMSKG